MYRRLTFLMWRCKILAHNVPLECRVEKSDFFF